MAGAGHEADMEEARAMFSTFVTDFDEFQKCADIRMRYLGVATPTSTTLGVTHLAGPEFMIQIKVSPSSIPEKPVRAVPSAAARKPDPSTGQTGSVAAPIEGRCLKRRLVARCCPTVAIATRAQAVTATKYRPACRLCRRSCRRRRGSVG